MDDKEKYEIFITNPKEEKYMKQFVFPSFEFSIQKRVRIIKAICDYIKKTKPDIIKRYQMGKCMRIKDEEYIKKYGMNNPESS